MEQTTRSPWSVRQAYLAGVQCGRRLGRHGQNWSAREAAEAHPISLSGANSVALIDAFLNGQDAGIAGETLTSTVAFWRSVGYSQ